MLSEREAQILRHVVRAYIDTGQAVSSGSISRAPGLGLSSASVRAVMATLEGRGMLHQAHTSAGRVPTLEAMRLYVEALRARPGRSTQLPPLLAERLRVPGQVGDVVREASQVLSTASSLAGLASPPPAPLARISHLELIGLSQQRALVVLVWHGEQVEHHVVGLPREVDPDELHAMQRYLGETIVGLTLPQARQRLEREVCQERVRCDDMIAGAVALGERALEGHPQREVYLEGELNLLEVGEFEDVRQLGAVLRALRDKALLRDILDQIDDKASTHVTVGLLAHRGNSPGEGVDGLHDCSLIVAPYRLGGQWLGWVGVVGPVRMRYKRLIPLVESAAREISACLEAQRVA